MSEFRHRYGTVDIVGARTLDRRRFGVPIGGASDRESQALANTLVGNEPLHPCLEVALSEVTLTFGSSSILAIVGAAETVVINGRAEVGNASYVMASGDRVIVAPPGRGCRTLVAISGASFDPPHFSSSPRILRTVRLAEQPTSLKSQISYIPSDSHPPLTQMKVLPAMDRLGVRCQPTPCILHQTENPSIPICPGTIQITPDGTAIVIGPDGPTIGGYPIAGYVIDAHLDRVGQWTPGTVVSLEPVTREEALLELQRTRHQMARRIAALKLAIAL